MNKVIYIVDIKKKQNSTFRIKNEIDENSTVISLTPYSCYLLDLENIKYKTFHSLISINDFREKVFQSYAELEKVFKQFPDFGYIFRNLALLKNYEILIDVLFNYIDLKKKRNYKIVYISDVKKENKIEDFNFSSNDNSGIIYNESIEEFRYIDQYDSSFYASMNKKKLFYKVIYSSNIYLKVKNMLFTQYNTLKYDYINFYNFWKKKRRAKICDSELINTYNSFMEVISPILIKKTTKIFISYLYTKILNELRIQIENAANEHDVIIEPFVYLSNYKDYVRSSTYQKNELPTIFMQHGSYFHDHIFLFYNEIKPAKINFVFNEYTKKIFLQNNAKNVYTVGSINFNKKIVEKNKKYDFVYITNCAYYSYTGTYIDGENIFYSMDGNNIYEKHKGVIELFGKKLKDKKICIKMHQGIVDTMLYIPLVELSKNYSNVKVEFFEPLHKLIEKSKYIISDYFSSEFINRELHYKRDIILFKGMPSPLSEKTLGDMEKMFILVDTITDLEEKIENIEELSKNRKRYDDIIEYYSSKRCDTKKVVIDILEKEFNER